MVSMSDMSPVTLFQAVSSSSAVTTPIMRVHSENNHTLFIHYTEQTHKMMFHWLNVNPNTTNSRFVQHGWKNINFGTKIYCESFSFTMVSKYLLSFCEETETSFDTSNDPRYMHNRHSRNECLQSIFSYVMFLKYINNKGVFLICSFSHLLDFQLCLLFLSHLFFIL